MNAVERGGVYAALDFVHEFLEQTEGPMWVCSLLNPHDVERDRKRTHRFVLTRDVVRIGSFIKRRDEPCYGLFFSVATMTRGEPRKKEFACELPYLFCDIDFKHVSLPPEDVISLVLALPCPPSRVHRSGGGLHCYWRLSGAAKPRQHERVERMLKTLAWLLGADPLPTHRVALLRMPGTHNTKNGGWRQVTVAHKADATYSLDRLEQWLTEHQAPLVRKRSATTRDDADQNPFTKLGAHQERRPPVDVFGRLEAMTVGGDGENGVHNTQLSCTASMMRAGVDEDQAVRLILHYTMLLPGTEQWDWRQEEQAVRAMCRDYLKKQGKKNG